MSSFIVRSHASSLKGQPRAQSETKSRPSARSLERTSQPRQATPLLRNSSQPKINNSFPNVQIKKNNLMTIPYTDLIRMQGSCKLESEEKNLKLQERKGLYEKSLNKVKNWPNTIAANRRKNENDKFEKFKREEEEKRKIDLEEQQFRNEQRKFILDRANKQIYEGGDRNKTFNSKMLVVDAIFQRDHQIELRKQVKELEDSRDIVFQAYQQETMDKYDEKEFKTAADLFEKKQYCAQVLKEQKDEQVKKYLEKMQDDKIEGEIIKEQAVQAAQKEKNDLQRQKDKQRNLAAETRAQNILMQTMKSKEHQRQMRQEVQIQQYSLKKDEAEKFRREREKEIRTQLQDSRQKMIDVQVENLKKVKNKQDSILNKQIEEAEIKAEEIEKKKVEMRRNLLQRIDVQMKQTVERKTWEKEQQSNEDKAFQEHWRKKNIEIQEKEDKEKCQKRERSKDLARYHQKQIVQKEQQREEHFLNELNEAEHIKWGLENKERQFESWASRIIHEYNGEGKNIQPLLKEIKAFKMS